MATQAPPTVQTQGAAAAAKEGTAAPGVRTLLVNLLIGVVAGLGLLVLAVSTGLALRHPAQVPVVMIVGAFALGAARLDAYGARVSVTTVPVIAAAYLAGPAGAALAGFAAAAGTVSRAGRPSKSALFNLGIGPAAAVVAALAAGPAGGHDQTAVHWLVLYGLVSGIVLYAVNVAPVCCALALQAHVQPQHVWRERFRWMVPQCLLLAQVGVGLAVAYRLVGLYEIGVFALPVVVMQLAWGQYLAHTRRSVEDLRLKNNELVNLAGRLQTANDTISATYQETLDALITALDARDNEVQGHSYRVSVFSQEIALAMGVERSSPEFQAIARGALLHDVGKIGVRDAVLLKPGKLDPGEWVEMKQHSEIGFGILRDVEFLRPAADLVRAHHEKFDGTGYPLGLKGEEIPLGARIFAVADTFDAITTDRVYRAAAPPQAAVAEIRRCAGTQFDPAVVEVFEQIWPRLWELREAAGLIAA